TQGGSPTPPRKPGRGAPGFPPGPPRGANPRPGAAHQTTPPPSPFLARGAEKRRSPAASLMTEERERLPPEPSFREIPRTRRIGWQAALVQSRQLSERGAIDQASSLTQTPSRVGRFCALVAANTSGRAL